MTVKEKAKRMGVSVNTYYKMAKKATSKTSTESKSQVKRKISQKDESIPPKEEIAKTPKQSLKQKKASKKKVLESNIPVLKESVIECVSHYAVEKPKEWSETVTDNTFKKIDVDVNHPQVVRSLHPFQVLMYVQDMAKKTNYAVYNFRFTDKGYAFTLIGPIENTN